MAFQLSPGVNVTEIDLTTVVPAVATSDGALAGLFHWGPVGERYLVDNENVLAKTFGKPDNYNAETFFTAANFLSYSNRLYVVRAANTSGVTPSVSANVTNASANVIVTNTATLSAGMYLTQVSNSNAFNTGKSVVISAIINATAFTMSSNAGVSNGAVTMYFGRPETSYSAVGFDTNSANAFVANLVNQIVPNLNAYTTLDGTFDSDIAFVAKYPGDIGNSLRVSVCDTVNAFSSNVDYVSGTVVDFTNTSITYTTGTLQFAIGSNTASIIFPGSATVNASANVSKYSIGDKILAGNASIGFQYLQITKAPSVTNSGVSNTTVMTLQFQDPYRLHTAYSTNSVARYWEFNNVVDSAPGISNYVLVNGNTAARDELHVVVVDDNGQFTGTPGSVLEVFKGLSRATDAKNLDTTVNYYKDVINQNSRYIWWANDRSGAASANAALITSSTNYVPSNIVMTLGSDGLNESSSNNFSVIASAYDLFASAEDIDISLVLQGRPIGPSGSSWQLSNYLIDNIAEIRKDCVVFVSPDKNQTLNSFGTEATNLVGWRNSVRSTSYAVIDSGYKYQYDRYNDIYRWIPLNGDIAGLCARTDNTNDAWWSPAGFNRGQIKNIVKLAYNPRKADRDILYKNGINPVVTFPGQGTVLYGDKTAQAKPSAFDRINVRRLFIVLEKAISTAAKYSLFEFNDAFTRSQFKNLVTPYLRNIQGRRGITDFLVVCDDTNNTPQIVDTNQFVGDIYIKPARSINFIQLNFVAVASGVQFSEVVGKF